MRAAKISVLAVLAGVLLLPVAGAAAQTSPRAAQPAQMAQAVTDEPLVVRPPPRIRIYPRNPPEPDVYPRYFPGSDAVRVCNAALVPEYRPSGTVIVPHMHCVWRRG